MTFDPIKEVFHLNRESYGCSSKMPNLRQRQNDIVV